MPKVSVIIPTHNRAVPLQKAVKSVLEQSYADFEILVCDDASTDNTGEVIKGFSDDRIRYTRHEKNIGVTAVRNRALGDSRGGYIAFLDDDDEWLPGKLEEQVGLLEKSTDKLGVVYTGVNCVDMKLGNLVKVLVPQYRGYILNDLLFHNFITTSSTVVKKTCFETVGLFDPQFGYAEDYDMWIRIAAKFDFDYIAKPMINYALHLDKISMNYNTAIRGLEQIIIKHESLFSRHKSAYTNQLFAIGIFYCYNGNISRGRQVLIKALKMSPLDARLYYNILISFLGQNLFIKMKNAKEQLFQT